MRQLGGGVALLGLRCPRTGDVEPGIGAGDINQPLCDRRSMQDRMTCGRFGRGSIMRVGLAGTFAVSRLRARLSLPEPIAAIAPLPSATGGLR
jgi:hypothetical protein